MTQTRERGVLAHSTMEEGARERQEGKGAERRTALPEEKALKGESQERSGVKETREVQGGGSR
jgi:hypothetical protein